MIESTKFKDYVTAREDAEYSRGYRECAHDLENLVDEAEKRSYEEGYDKGKQDGIEEGIQYMKLKDSIVERGDKAIKALEQEPCEDAISRQAVLDVFGCVMDYWKEHAIDVEPHEIKDALIEQYEFTAKQLSDLPPVNPQPKTGHWIMTNEVDVLHGLPSYECSKCGQISLENGNYCPSCGAKMVEPQESEE